MEEIALTALVRYGVGSRRKEIDPRGRRVSREGVDAMTEIEWWCYLATVHGQSSNNCSIVACELV